jgi:hypothetical protein
MRNSLHEISSEESRHGVELMDVTPILEFFREQDLVYRGEIIR